MQHMYPHIFFHMLLYLHSILFQYYSYNYIAYNQKKRWFDKAIFDKRIKLRFVDSDFWAPVGYDEILKCYYGDYMKIPSNKSMDTNVPSRFFKKRSWRNV